MLISFIKFTFNYHLISKAPMGFPFISLRNFILKVQLYHLTVIAKTKLFNYPYIDGKLHFFFRPIPRKLELKFNYTLFIN